MAEHISMDLETVLRSVKSMTAGLTTFPDDADIAHVNGIKVSETVEYHKGLHQAATLLGQKVDSLRGQIASTRAAILATVADMAKADASIADEVRALFEAFGGLAAANTPAASTPATTNVPVLPSATKGTVQKGTVQ